jgi:hypothetical protein
VVNASGQQILAASGITAVLSAEGTISVPGLVCTDNTGLNPPGWAYTFNVAVAGAVGSFTSYLPSGLGATADISQLIAAPVPSSVTTYVTSVNGQSGAVLIPSPADWPYARIGPGTVATGVASPVPSLLVTAPANSSAAIFVVADDPLNPRAEAGTFFITYDYRGNPGFAVPPAGGARMFGDRVGSWVNVFTLGAQLVPWGGVQPGGSAGPTIYGGAGAPPNATLTAWMSDYSVTANAGDPYFRTDGSGPTALYQCAVAGTSGSPGGTWVPTTYLCPPAVYAPGTLATFATASGTLAAVSSANVNTGAFLAPPSGNVLVTASCTVGVSASDSYAFAVAQHGSVTPAAYVIGGAVNAAAIHPQLTLPFTVTGLSPGSSYTLDLLFAAGGTGSTTVSVFALGTKTTTPTTSQSGPVFMSVQAL